MSKAELRLAPSGWWYVFVENRAIFGPETYQVAANVEHFINNPKDSDNSECAEVAGILREAHECGLI